MFSTTLDLSGTPYGGQSPIRLPGVIVLEPVLPFYVGYGQPSCQLAAIGSPMVACLFDPCGSAGCPC